MVLVIKAKILLQLLFNWDDLVPREILDVWTQWRFDLSSLSSKHIPRCYYPNEATIVSTQLHGFSDASENAYAGVVYLRMVDS